MPQDVSDTWLAPVVFGLADGKQRTALLSALDLLRKKIGFLGENVTLDFTNTETMFADGVLLFLAELKRLIKYVKGTVEVNVVLPNNRKVAQVLKQVGILDLLGVKAQIVPEDHDVINWRAASGSRVLGEKYDAILQKYDGEITQFLQDNLYTGITEAMTNVTNHAYDLLREDGLKITDQKNWWMFSHEKEGYLSVVFCDLGAGIPRTLPVKRRNVWNRLKRKGLRSDSEVIKFAVKDSVSRTRKSHRGKGLRQIMEVIDGLTNAEAVVYSNKGVFAMQSDGTSRCLDYSDSIMGTLIFWSMPLPVKEAV